MQRMYVLTERRQVYLLISTCTSVSQHRVAQLTAICTALTSHQRQFCRHLHDEEPRRLPVLRSGWRMATRVPCASSV